MIHIAVVDDELSMREQLGSYVETYAKEHGERVRLSLFSDGDALVYDYTADYDIIFLDIQMARMGGMETAERIRILDGEVLLIFITNMANYAIRGYAVDAMNYILKPVSYFAFSQQLGKAIDQLENRQSHRQFSHLLLTVDTGVMRVPTSSIYYVETAPHQRLLVHTKTGEYLTRGTLKDMEQKLGEDHFVRCNNCYLVNLLHVKGIDEMNALVGPHALLISRPRKKGFLDALTAYLGGI